MNHTPGPFIVRHDYNEDTTFITESHGIDLAQVFRLPEYENNSALFAAAPDLLAALTTIQAFSWSLPRSLREDDRWKIVDTAIAKAEGKETL